MFPAIASPAKLLDLIIVGMLLMWQKEQWNPTRYILAYINADSQLDMVDCMVPHFILSPYRQALKLGLNCWPGDCDSNANLTQMWAF